MRVARKYQSGQTADADRLDAGVEAVTGKLSTRPRQVMAGRSLRICLCT